MILYVKHKQDGKQRKAGHMHVHRPARVAVEGVVCASHQGGRHANQHHGFQDGFQHGCILAVIAAWLCALHALTSKNNVSHQYTPFRKYFQGRVEIDRPTFSPRKPGIRAQGISGKATFGCTVPRALDAEVAPNNGKKGFVHFCK